MIRILKTRSLYKMKIINYILGFIGILIGVLFLANGNENASFQTKFIIKTVGFLLFFGSIFLVRKSSKSGK